MFNKFLLYLPLIIAVLVIVLIYKFFIKRFRYQRMLQSVRQQRRVNLSPWTNFSLLFGTLAFVLVGIGLLWAEYDIYHVLLYSLSFYFAYLIFEFIRRKWLGESTRLIFKLAGVLVIFAGLIITVNYAYKTPMEEMARGTWDLHFLVSNDSYPGAGVNDSPATDNSTINVDAVIDGQTYNLGKFSDNTRRDQSFLGSGVLENFKGEKEGWTQVNVDLTPYLSATPKEITIKFTQSEGPDCSHTQAVYLLKNKIKGEFPKNQSWEQVFTSCNVNEVIEYQMLP